MNVLFSAHVKNREEARICTAILESLKRLGNNLIVLKEENICSGGLSDSFKTYHVKNGQQQCLDLILTYDKAGLDQIEAFTRTNNTPVIALLNACSDYIADYNQIDKVVLLNKPVDYPSILFQSEQVFSWKIPCFFNPNVNYQIKKTRKHKILVDMNGKGSCFSPLYQIIPCLNKLLNYDISVISDIVNLSKMLNENIKVIKDRDADIEHLIEESDIVIGCGETISKTIAFGRPVIVVGERGFGGLITKETFQQQYQNNFQGRIGGEQGEYIPEKLFLDSIFDLAEWQSEFVNIIIQENWELLKHESIKQEKAFNDFLQQIIKSHKQIKDDLENINLKLSINWELVPFSKGNFSFVNALTGHLHCHFEKEEAEIIELFRKESKVRKALEEAGYKEEPRLFLDFIRVLVNEKILVPSGN